MIAFVIQEIPYIIMPLVNPVHNPIMCMQNEIEWLVTIQNILGVLTINFIGWTAYYSGYQYGWLIVISQFMAVPLYYLFYGVWKSNYPMAGTAALFLIFHTMNGYVNFATQ